MKLYRALGLAALLSIGVCGSSFAGTTPKTAKAGHKATAAALATAAAAVQYECAHCNVKMSAKEAKAHGMKCSACGAKLTVVKKPAKSATKAKKA